MLSKRTGRLYRRVLDELKLTSDQVLMIGDSLTSDIRGAKGAGIAACWFNPRQEAPIPGISMDYEIHSLPQRREFL